MISTPYSKRCPYCHEDLIPKTVLVDAFYCAGDGSSGDGQYFVESQDAGGRLLHPVDVVIDAKGREGEKK